MSNADVVLRFEDEFKNKANHDIVEEVMSPELVHHAPYPGLPAGQAGVRAIGEFVVGAISDISVTVDLVIEDGDLVADRVSASGIRRDTGENIAWTENHIYSVRDGAIVEWWPEGGPPLD